MIGRGILYLVAKATRLSSSVPRNGFNPKLATTGYYPQALE